MSLTPILIYISLGVLLDGNHKLLVILMSLLFLIIGYQVKSKRSKMFFFIPFFAILLFSFFLPDALYSVLILYTVLVPLSFLIGSNLKSYSKFLLVSVFIGVHSFVFLYAFENFHVWVNNLNSEKMTVFPEITFMDLENNEVSVSSKNDKLYVLDFWNSTCGVCFKKFPEFENLVEEYENQKDVVFYSVNVPVKNEEFDQRLDLVKSLGYRFDTVFTQDDSCLVQLGFNTFPRLILVKNGKIVYNGSLVTSNGISKKYRLPTLIEKFRESK